MKLRCAWWINLTVFACSSLVRADAPPDRYSFPSAGVVYDTRTKLTWQQNSSNIDYSQAEALMYCASLTLAGSGWRVPLISELLTLVDVTQREPAIDERAFPNTPPLWFWTSTTTSDDAIGWAVEFLEGVSGRLASTGKFPVRCVR